MIAILMVMLVGAHAASAVAGTLNGRIKLGGVSLDEEGDLSAVQETYNIHDGFSISQIRLDGSLKPRQYFMLNLREINLDGRQGDFLYRVPGRFKLTAGYDQHRQVFDSERAVNSERKDMKFGLQYSPSKWMSLSGNLGYLMREGERLRYPMSTGGVLGPTTTALGTEYDNVLLTGRIGADLHKGRRGVAVTYRMSDYTDDLNSGADRTGYVVSARAYMPDFYYDKATHLVRGAYGVRKLSEGDIEYTLANFQYTGVVQPVDEFQFKYNFDANRIDHETTDLQTDRYQNNFDATYFHKHGRVTGGYGYEMNDDDRTLTSYQSWRAGTAVRFAKKYSARIDYSGRVKKDEEELTLLKDVEASRLRARVQVEPLDDVLLGAGYVQREREYPDIDVKAEGDVLNLFWRYGLDGWGSFSGDYSFSTDEYTDLVAGFETESHVVTGRVD
ncbi:MAG: hypothetical protein HKN20_15365, partial [Gemmatimonadetes bacterium]|nr:hypothetical protein [Gemmatimonadota bacterium]